MLGVGIGVVTMSVGGGGEVWGEELMVSLPEAVYRAVGLEDGLES